MTADEWATSTDATAMLAFARGRASERKLRLAVCAYVRQAWPVMEDRRGRAAVEAAEAFADGRITKAALRRAREGVVAQMADMIREHGGVLTGDAVRRAEYRACEAARRAATERGYLLAVPRMRDTVGLSALRGRATDFPPILREVVGDPFNVIRLDPSCVSPTSSALAGAIYEGRAFDRLPILADSLEESGIDLPDVLAHLRGGVEHYLGCWALDAVIGRV